MYAAGTLGYDTTAGTGEKEGKETQIPTFAGVMHTHGNYRLFPSTRIVPHPPARKRCGGRDFYSMILEKGYFYSMILEKG